MIKSFVCACALTGAAWLVAGAATAAPDTSRVVASAKSTLATPATDSGKAGSGEGRADEVAPQDGREDKRFVMAIASEPKSSKSNSLYPSIHQAKTLTIALSTEAKVVTMKSLREIARAGWAGELDAGWLPANLAVGLLNKGYTLLGSDGVTTQMALVATARIQSARDLPRKVLYVPQEDSLAAYVGFAMLSELNVRLSDLAGVYSNGTYEVAQLAIANGIHDVTVLPESLALDLVQANPGKARILAVSPDVPTQMLVVRSRFDQATQAKLRAWTVANLNGGRELVTPGAEAMKYVSRIAHYTPEELQGVNRITARQAADLVARGAVVVDVRSSKEFGAKRIPNAKSLPYTEITARVAGGTYVEDQFAVNEIPSKEVILYCNGPECWKSYKAAKRAIDSGRFKRVYWLRGGLPEWEREGLPVIQG